MKSIYIIISLILLTIGCVQSAQAEGQWMSFTLIERPYYDRHGQVLTSIKGRKNRFGRDEFYGGGLVYPDLAALKVTEKYTRGKTILIKSEYNVKEMDVLLSSKATSPDILVSNVVRQNQYYTKYVPVLVMGYKLSDFTPTLITDQEAQAWLFMNGFSPDQITSGVSD